MKDILIIDIEASGLYSDSYPTEIAYGDPFSRNIESYLIKPTTFWQGLYWDPEAEKITGITKEKIANAVPACDIAKLIAPILNKADIVLSDAPEWDQRWLNMLFDSGGIHITPKIESFHRFVNQINPSAEYRFLENNLPVHRAEADVRILMECFIEEAWTLFDGVE
jgi:hypothetical protein